MQAVALEIRKSGRKAATFKADVSDRSQVYAAVTHAEKGLGRFDIIVKNAGIAQVKAIADVEPGEVDQIVKINVNGVLWGIQAAKKFKERGKSGRSSVPARSLGMTASSFLGCIPRQSSQSAH
jgi:meso-butanediol dehydrogenase/(S,S)-butanediol dehydrogenase/diacetyl reductase